MFCIFSPLYEMLRHIFCIFEVWFVYFLSIFRFIYVNFNSSMDESIFCMKLALF